MVNELILAGCSVGGGIAVFAADKALKNKTVNVFKRQLSLAGLVSRVLALLLFCVYIPHIFGLEEISNQVGLDTGTLFSKSGYVLNGVMDWVTTFVIAAAITVPFFSKKQEDSVLS